MKSTPSTASGYETPLSVAARSTCLYLATKLGDLMSEIVVVGGLVPSLIIDQSQIESDEKHIGTIDLDLGLSISVLDQHKYDTIRERLKEAWLRPDRNESDRETPQRWVLDGRDSDSPRLTVDFLIPSKGLDDHQKSTSKFLAKDLAAQPADALHLAFRNQLSIEIDGQTPFGETARRTVNVCGPGAFVALKSRAFRNRGANKDAYDLHYVTRWYGKGPSSVVEHLRPLMDDPSAKQAIQYLREDFANRNSIGPMRVAQFRGLADAEAANNLKSDVLGDIQELLKALDE